MFESLRACFSPVCQSNFTEIGQRSQEYRHPKKGGIRDLRSSNNGRLYLGNAMHPSWVSKQTARVGHSFNGDCFSNRCTF